ncbi:hypothetical protein Tco_1283755 [Tanacetum coccineum]
MQSYSVRPLVSGLSPVQNKFMAIVQLAHKNYGGKNSSVDLESNTMWTRSWTPILFSVRAMLVILILRRLLSESVKLQVVSSEMNGVDYLTGTFNNFIAQYRLDDMIQFSLVMLVESQSSNI